ncbi:MAG TPA: hypothetical protein VF629_01965 [Hymenobacter sp.]|jgi:hypothetical protein|uniref:hypothetical protein n=1 Tax=Hymenobacter sp. TaxID=1898978 RepID=UPI002EDA0DA6
MMAAGGSVLIALVYAILGLLLFRSFLGWRRANTPVAKSTYLIRSVITGSLLVGFAYSQYSFHQQDEAKYIGVYALTQYPRCPTCVLYLESDNRYEVRQGTSVKEAGPWRYESGGDYWIVYINETEQLGNGKYSYDFPKSSKGVRK